MSECIERDDLVTLLAALDGPPLRTLDHLAGCDRCRREIAALGRVRELLLGDDAVPDGFVAGVMARIEDADDAVVADAPAAAGPVGAVGAEDRSPPEGRAGHLGSLAAAVGLTLVTGVAITLVLAGGLASGSSPVDLSSTQLVLGFLTAAGLVARELVGSGRTAGRPADAG